MPKNSILLLVMSIPLVLAPLGCSTATLQERSVTDAPWSGTAVLMNYNLLNGDGSPVTDDCALVLSSQGKDVSVSLPAGTDRALVDAPAGTYQWKSVSCSHFNRWVLGQSLGSGFTAVAGRIGFVGRVTFRFPRKASPDQSLTARIGSQESATQSLAIDMQSLPAQWASAFENPYTLKPITAAMLAPKGIYRMQVLYGQQLAHGMTAFSTRSLERALNACDQDEQKRFPYRMGSLNDVATYADGKFQQLRKSGENSFSDEFLSCIDASLRAFVPPYGVQLKVTVLL